MVDVSERKIDSLGADTNARPTVSIGMPVRNGESFIEEALQSLLDQTFDDFELIISDNASEDRTSMICEHYARRDRRIRYSRLQTNVGAAPNFNQVFRLARGRFFKWAFHDDTYLPDYLIRCVQVFQSSPPNVVVVYPRTELIDEKNRSLGFDPLSLSIEERMPHRRLTYFIKNIHWSNPIFGLIRSESLRKTRLHDSFISSDYVLLAELLLLGEFREVPEVLFRRRFHPNRATEANPSPGALRRWFNPSKRIGPLDLLPIGLRLQLEYVRSVYRIPIGYSDKFKCLAAIAKTGVTQEIRNIGGLYKRRIKNWLIQT